MAIGALALVMAVETLVPWRKVQDAPMARWLNNIALTGLDYAILFATGPYLILFAAQTVAWPKMGLLGHFNTSPLVSFVILALLMEFLNYWLHRAYHHIPALWRIHAVHHSDLEMDATTSHRHHPLEMLINSCVIIPAVLLLGPDTLTLLIYNMFRIGMAVLSHGNFSLWPGIDRVLRLFIVTPDFHRLHHSPEQCYTNSNYSAIFPWCDYLFHTTSAKSHVEQQTMDIGLEYFRSPRYNRLDQILWMPFSKVFSQKA